MYLLSSLAVVVSTSGKHSGGSRFRYGISRIPQVGNINPRMRGRMK
jgi:hypothetical protein